MPPVHAVAVTSDGYSLRFSFEGFVEPSTRSGRRYARPADGVEVVGVSKIDGTETIIAATADARAMLCKIEEINFLSGPGKGVILIKIDPKEDRVLGFLASTGDRDLMTVETSRGAEQTISTGEVRGDEPRREGPGVAAARSLHAHRDAGRLGAREGVTRASWDGRRWLVVGQGFSPASSPLA